jgi:hypothetical protein
MARRFAAINMRDERAQRAGAHSALGVLLLDQSRYGKHRIPCYACRLPASRRRFIARFRANH